MPDSSYSITSRPLLVSRGASVAQQRKRGGSNAHWLTTPPCFTPQTNQRQTPQPSIATLLPALAFFLLLRYILCNSTSILFAKPHLQLCVTRRCFPGIESPKARIERISISLPTCQNRKPCQHGFRVGAGQYIAGEERYVYAGFKVWISQILMKI